MVSSASRDTTTSETAPTGLQTLTQRCAATGVVLCIDFENSTDVTDNMLADGKQSNAVWENTITAGGAGALKFNVPDSDGPNSGNWFHHLRTDLGTFGNGDDFYVQYRYRLDEAMWRYRPRTSVAFDAGNDDFSVGTTITGGTSGATCVVAVVVLESGAWSGTAAGHVVCSSASGVEFIDNESLTATGPSGHATATNFAFPAEPDSEGGGFKLSILSCWYDGDPTPCSGSNQANEIVIQDTLYRDFFHMYWQANAAFTNLQEPRSTPCNGSNYSWQNSIDVLLPSAPSTCAQYANRYGPIFDYGTGSGTPTPGDITATGHPRSEALAAGVEIDSDVWYTIKLHVTLSNLETASNRVEVWVAEDGQASVKIMDANNIELDSANGGYNGIWLVPFDTGRQTYSKGHDATVYYDELIVSTEDIADPVESDPVGALPSWTSGLTTQTWYQPATANTIRDVSPCPADNCNYSNHGLTELGKGTWGSGAWAPDFGTSYGGMFQLGGGHDTYRGNEIYFLNFSDLNWDRMSDPFATPTSSGTDGDGAFSDGSPLLGHGWGNYGWRTGHGQLYNWLGHLTITEDNNGNHCQCTSFATPTFNSILSAGALWDRLTNDDGVGSNGDATAYDEARDVFYIYEDASNYRIRKYNPSASSGSRVSTFYADAVFDLYVSMVVVPTIDKLVLINTDESVGKEGVWTLDLTTPAGWTKQTLSGASLLTSGVDGTGLWCATCSGGGQIIYYGNEGRLFTIDPDTWVVVALPDTAGTEPEEASYGTSGANANHRGGLLEAGGEVWFIYATDPDAKPFVYRIQ
jgi:hypothetical protein